MVEKSNCSLPEECCASKKEANKRTESCPTELADEDGSQNEEDSDGKKKSSPPTWKTYLILLLLFIAYICLNLIGALIFEAIEQGPPGKRHPFADRKRAFVEANGSNLTIEVLNDFIEEVMVAVGEVDKLTANDTFYREPWTLHQGFLLCFSIASTIGYGVLTPTTTGGQMFAVFFALIGIPFTGLLAAKLGSVLAYLIKKAAKVIFWGRKSHQWIKMASILFTFIVGLFIYIIIPSIVLAYVDNDEGWSFAESFYCVFTTLTTIGFGDYVPDPHASLGMTGNILVLIWVVAGLAWVATIVNLIATTISKQATSIKNKVAANHKFSVKSIKHRLGGKTKSHSLTDTLKKYPNSPFAKEASRKGDEERELAEVDITKSGRKSSQDGSEAGVSDSKRNSLLGPSGIMSVVVNNLERFKEDEITEETE